MECFRAKPTVKGEQSVEGQEAYHLPFMTCPYCNNRRGIPSIKYPWIDIKHIFGSTTEKRLRLGRARIRGTDPTDFTWEEFGEIKANIRKILDPAYPLPPTTHFGILQGKIYAKPPTSDFVMPDDCTLLARRKVVEMLNELGNNLRYFEVKLKQQKGQTEDFVQVWAPPLGISGPSSGNKFCPHCERGSGRELFTIKKPGVELDTSLFVLKDALGPIHFTEKLVKDIEQTKYSGLSFEKVASE